MVGNAKKHYRVLSIIILVISLFLMGCQSSKNVVDETIEQLLVNENVTLENYEKIKIGDPKTGNGGMTYEEVLILMGEISPQFHSEIMNEDGKTEVEANWWRYNRDHQFGTDLIGVKFIDGKAFSKFEEGLE
jgi:malate synthase